MRDKNDIKGIFAVLIAIAALFAYFTKMGMIVSSIDRIKAAREIKQGYEMYEVKNCSGHIFLEEYTENEGYLCNVIGDAAESVTVPSEYKGDPVIAVTSASGNSILESLIVEDGVEYIENGFSDYNALRSVILPSSIKAVYRGSFQRCTSLESMEFHGDLASVGEDSFRGCSALRQVVFHGDVDTICKRAFSECPALEEVIFEGNVGCVEEEAFAGCPELTDVQLPEDTVVRVGAFSESGRIQIGEGGVFAYCEDTYDKDALKAFAGEFAGTELPEDKKLDKSSITRMAGVWNGPLLAADRIADCDRYDYDVSKLPEGLTFNIIDVSEIEQEYPGTVYTKEKETDTLSGEKPLVFCICELTGYSEGPEYIFGGSPANYLGYRFSFLDAADGRLIGWYECAAGYAPGMYTIGEDVIAYYEKVGEDAMRFFLDEDGERPTPLKELEKLIFNAVPQAE